MGMGEVMGVLLGVRRSHVSEKVGADLRQKRILRLEVRIEGAATHIGFLQDVPDGDLTVGLFREHLFKGGDLSIVQTGSSCLANSISETIHSVWFRSVGLWTGGSGILQDRMKAGWGKSRMETRRKNVGEVLIALLSAAAYGVSIPLIKIFETGLQPFLASGLLYLGADLSMALAYASRAMRSPWETGISGDPRGRALAPRDIPLITVMVLLNVASEGSLLAGIRLSGAASASLLSNFEIAATALLAFLLFKERMGAFMWTAVAMITASSMIALAQLRIVPDRIRLSDLPDDAAGVSRGKDTRGDIARDDAACPDDAAGADGDPSADGDVCGEPDPILDGDGSGVLIAMAAAVRRSMEFALAGDEGMDRCAQRAVRPEEHIVPDGDGGAVQDGGPGVDEAAVSDAGEDAVVEEDGGEKLGLFAEGAQKTLKEGAALLAVFLWDLRKLCRKTMRPISKREQVRVIRVVQLACEHFFLLSHTASFGRVEGCIS